MGSIKKIIIIAGSILGASLMCGDLLKPAAPKRKSVSALKEECAKLCEKALEATRRVYRKLLDCDEKTVTVFKRVVDDALLREELEKQISELTRTINVCESLSI